jgi:hypothetical protein
MNSAFLSLPETQRRRAIQEVAVRRGVSPVIIEKDLWVCYLLSILFRCQFGESLVFKGGTSLSKVFGAIDRFSEDIDLSLSPEWMELPEPGASRNQAQHQVTPWLAEEFPQLFGDWNCPVVALEIERTFWEKATILHAECYRPDEKPTPDRFSRHYADTAALSQHPDGQKAIHLDEMRMRVVQWKSRFFGSSWARYDLAVPGSFRLVPSERRIEALRRDYQAMRDMYLVEPLPFDEVIRRLTDLQTEINCPRKP